MQIVSNGDNLHERTNPVFLIKKKKTKNKKKKKTNKKKKQTNKQTKNNIYHEFVKFNLSTGTIQVG